MLLRFLANVCGITQAHTQCIPVSTSFVAFGRTQKQVEAQMKLMRVMCKRVSGVIYY